MKSELTQAAKARLDRGRAREARGLRERRGRRHRRAYRRMAATGTTRSFSERRAESVKPTSPAKASDRDRIETLGMGKTVPGEILSDIKRRSELISCLAPTGAPSSRSRAREDKKRFKS